MKSMNVKLLQDGHTKKPNPANLVHSQAKKKKNHVIAVWEKIARISCRHNAFFKLYIKFGCVWDFFNR